MKVEKALERLLEPGIITGISGYKTREAVRTLVAFCDKKVHQGSWILEDGDISTWRCSECDSRIAEEDVKRLPKFCPECSNDKRRFLEIFIKPEK